MCRVNSLQENDLLTHLWLSFFSSNNCFSNLLPIFTFSIHKGLQDSISHRFVIPQSQLNHLTFSFYSVFFSLGCWLWKELFFFSRVRGSKKYAKRISGDDLPFLNLFPGTSFWHLYSNVFDTVDHSFETLSQAVSCFFCFSFVSFLFYSFIITPFLLAFKPRPPTYPSNN